MKSGCSHRFDPCYDQGGLTLVITDIEQQQSPSPAPSIQQLSRTKQNRGQNKTRSLIVSLFPV